MHSPDFELAISESAHGAGTPVVPQPSRKAGVQPNRRTTCKPLRVGVVGCGYWGSNYVRILSSLDVGEVVAIDADRGVLEATATAYPSARPYSDLESALPFVDALIIASPPRTHSDLAIIGLRHGKHLLIEKPMALSVAEARSVIDAAEDSKKVLMVGHTFEFNAAVRELKERVLRGDLGRITRINSARLKGPYRCDVNVIWDMVPHDISIMNYLLDSVPTTVTAWASMNSSARIADMAYIKLDYHQLGITGYVHASWLGLKKVREVTVVGSKKVGVHDDTMKKRLHFFDRANAPDEFAGQLLSYGSGSVDSPHIRFDEPLLVQVNHFLGCINNCTLPQTDGENGLAVVAILEAIDESIAIGSTVKIRYPRGTNAPEILSYRRVGASS